MSALEDLPTFLQRPGPPGIKDPVTRAERVRGPMPELWESPNDRFMDALALLGLGMFFGAVLAIAIQGFWW